MLIWFNCIVLSLVFIVVIVSITIFVVVCYYHINDRDRLLLSHIFAFRVLRCLKNDSMNVIKIQQPLFFSTVTTHTVFAFLLSMKLFVVHFPLNWLTYTFPYTFHKLIKSIVAYRIIWPVFTSPNWIRQLCKKQFTIIFGSRNRFDYQINAIIYKLMNPIWINGNNRNVRWYLNCWIWKSRLRYDYYTRIINDKNYQ